MPTNDPNKIRDFLSRVAVSQNSVDWWEAQVCQIMSQISELEKDEAANEKEIDNLLVQLSNLIPRAKLELSTIDGLENEMKQFTQNEKAQKESKKSSSMRGLPRSEREE